MVLLIYGILDAIWGLLLTKKCQISAHMSAFSPAQWSTVLSEYEPELLLTHITEL